jgi:hypothetical protein
VQSVESVASTSVDMKLRTGCIAISTFVVAVALDQIYQLTGDVVLRPESDSDTLSRLAVYPWKFVTECAHFPVKVIRIKVKSRGCSLKKILVHFPKKFEKSGKSAKIRKSEKNREIKKKTKIQVLF